MDWIRKAGHKAKERLDGPPSTSPSTSTPASTSRPVVPQPLTDPVRVDERVPAVRVRLLGRQQSNLPHIYRDGGGGGTVAGQHIIIFADGTYTRGPPPTEPSRIVSFVSNSIGILGPRGAPATTIARVTDVGSADRGPDQAVPFLTDRSETAMTTAVWPNQNIATLSAADAGLAPGSSGDVGVCFPEVIDRRRYSMQQEALLYNTAVAIRLDDGHDDGRDGGHGAGHDGGRDDGNGRRWPPRVVVTRAAKSLFVRGEPMFGSFCTYLGAARDAGGEETAGDATPYLFLLGRVSEAAAPQSNGLKLARVRPRGWADRAQYEFWDGQRFSARLPPRDDGGAANVFAFSQDGFGTHYGPGTGDVWWSAVHGTFLLLFQSSAAALDNAVYLCSSTTARLTGPWSPPVRVFRLPTAADGFCYALHAYPNMMRSGDGGGGDGRCVVPISWTRDSKAEACSIETAEVVFE